MRARTRSVLAVVAVAGGLVGSTLVAPVTTALADTESWCTSGGPRPCIESVTHDDGSGTPVSVTSSDPTYNISVIEADNDGFRDLLFFVEKHTTNDLGPSSTDDTWDLTLDMGTLAPRMVAVIGDNLVVQRHHHADGSYSVEVVASPVHTTSGNCDTSSWPWTCTSPSTQDYYGLNGEVNDAGGWTDTSQIPDFWGMQMATNVEARDWPPQVVDDPTTGAQQLLTDLAAPHRYSNDDLFIGSFSERVPNAYLRDVYGVDDPASMTGSSLNAGFTGADTSAGSVTVSQESGGDAMLVNATGLKFSAKQLHVRLGTVTPTRPRHVSGKRLSAHKARVSFARSRSRGSKVRGYTVRCVSGNGKHHATGSSRRSPTRVAHLVTGTAYTCRVRARSHAGHSGWSAKVNIRRHR